MVATNQRDPNDRLILGGLDFVTVDDYSITAVNGSAIYFQGAVYVNGVPFGSGGGLTGYVHTQGVAASTWTINHNLGYKPIVQVYNAGSVMVLTEVENPSINQTIVRISPAQTGFARLV